MKKLWHDEAWEGYLYWQKLDKKYLKKINKLLSLVIGVFISTKRIESFSA